MGKFKVGDKVMFSKHEDDSHWEKRFGVAIGDLLTIKKVVGEIYYTASETGKLFWTDDNCISSLLEDEPTSSDGVKFDQDKLEYSLLPKGVLNQVVKVLGFGAKKYAKDNWMKVDNHKERYYNAMQRHINQWWEGEKFDSETGENHLAHAMCCLMFLLWFDNKEQDKSIEKEKEFE